MRIIAVANQKGGCGKTTTAAALAAGLGRKGYKVLAVDMDPQGNLSSASGADGEGIAGVYELLRGEAAAGETVQELEAFDMVPASIMLAGAERELSGLGREQRLREGLGPLAGSYDWAVIDTPPALGILTVNALTAADEVVVPTAAGIFEAAGIRQLHDTVLNVRKYCGGRARISGILLTRFDPRAGHSRDMRELTARLGEHIGARLYGTCIRASVVAGEAQARKQDVFRYKGHSAVARDYAAFVEEYLEGGRA
jgi:chromosome partitioning protein